MINVRLKVWQKVIYYAIFVAGIFIAFGLPLWSLLDKVVIEYWEVTKARYSFITIFAIGIFGGTGIIVLKRWYNRKLQAMAVASELNAVGMTSPLFKWLLLFLQFAVPLGIITALIYAFSYIRIPNYTLFLQFFGFFIGGFVVLVANDYLKIHFILANEVEQQVKLDEKKENLTQKKTYKVYKKIEKRQKNRNRS